MPHSRTLSHIRKWKSVDEERNWDQAESRTKGVLAEELERRPPPTADDSRLRQCVGFTLALASDSAKVCSPSLSLSEKGRSQRE